MLLCIGPGVNLKKVQRDAHLAMGAALHSAMLLTIAWAFHQSRLRHAFS